MDTDLLQQQLTDLLEQFDSIQMDWAIAKSEKEEIDDRKNPTLAIVEANVEGSTNAEKTRKALKSEVYDNWIKEAKKKRQAFYEIDHKKDGLKARIDVLRSLLSFSKFVQERTI